MLILKLRYLGYLPGSQHPIPGGGQIEGVELISKDLREIVSLPPLYPIHISTVPREHWILGPSSPCIQTCKPCVPAMQLGVNRSGLTCQ